MAQERSGVWCATTAAARCCTAATRPSGAGGFGDRTAPTNGGASTKTVGAGRRRERTHATFGDRYMADGILVRAMQPSVRVALDVRGGRQDGGNNWRQGRVPAVRSRDRDGKQADPNLARKHSPHQRYCIRVRCEECIVGIRGADAKKGYQPFDSMCYDARTFGFDARRRHSHSVRYEHRSSQGGPKVAAQTAADLAESPAETSQGEGTR